jgi:1-acyl-sn-glycerol-3-phosphate acyltransferase
MSTVQCLLWGAAYVLVKLLWRTRWEGSLPVPDGQGAVIVCNHRSSIDPFFLQTATGRKIHWMVAREYCEHPALAWFLATCEVIPVGRGGIDTAATKAALQIAERGGIVGMFPEGRINRTDDLMLPIRPGAAHVAVRAGVLLVPCYIDGSPYGGSSWSPLLMPARVTVRFGQPIPVQDATNHGPHADNIDDTQGSNGNANGLGESVRHEALMRRCVAQIAELAGEPEFQGQFAPRQWNPRAEVAGASTVG